MKNNRLGNIVSVFGAIFLAMLTMAFFAALVFLPSYIITWALFKIFGAAAFNHQFWAVFALVFFVFFCFRGSFSVSNRSNHQ